MCAKQIVNRPKLNPKGIRVDMKSIHRLIAIIGSGKIKVVLQIPIIKLR